MSCVVLVFAMPECPACEEFVPRFRQIAGQYPQVKSYVLDISQPVPWKLADQYGVNATPTMVVARRPRGMVKWEGAVPDREIHRALGIAARF